MSLETINQILSPTNATYINGVSAQRKFSVAVLANLYQGLVEKDGRGVNDRFVSAQDAEDSAQVFVNRVLPTKIKPREQGANKNGASFSANQHYTQTVTVGIEILTVLDDPIIIPRARQDMIKIDLLAEQTKIYSDRLKTILNGATCASKVFATYKAKADGKEVNTKQITATDIANKEVLDRFIEANSLLDEGDSENGIDIFPEDTRIAVFKTSYRATLKAKGVLVIGGANYAYDILAGGSLNKEKEVRKTEDGYIGEIDGVPCHLISNESLAHASEFLGFPANELKESPFIGYVASSYANARGVSTAKQTKIVDAINGQGVVLQPYTKFGVISWYPKGNVILTKADYDPITDLKAIFSGVAGNITFKVKGSGSRLYPEGTGTVLTVSATAFTISNVDALDDFNVDHVVGAYYLVSATAPKTVAEFIAGTKAPASVKGECVIGTEKSETIADTHYVTVLVISDDGSCALFSKQYNA